jgi:threonine dehydrogenase-like Zn-dependent dehydrogenase
LESGEKIMPLELIVRTPKEIDFVEYQDSEPTLAEVLVQTTISGIKHGTEINMYRGTLPFANELWDPTLRLFRSPGDDELIPPFYPHTLGSWAAGVVLKVGPDVRTFQPGDLVHGEWKHRQTAIKKETVLYRIPETVDDETMVFTDPARFALAAIHDAEIKLGDRVAVFGLGAIGMLTLQMARLDGAAQVIAVDPIPERLELACQLGADLAINPTDEDAGMIIKQVTGGRGVDVALEVSGAYASLQQAIRGVHKEGLVVTASYYGDRTMPLDLAREWHHNRITLRSSMPVWDCSHRNHPMWDLDRLERVAISLLEEKKLDVKPLIGARIPFESAAEAYDLIDQSAGDKIKIILTYCS